MEKIVVVENVAGKFGPQVKLVDGSYLSFGKFFKGDTALEPGAYEADIYRTAKGNGYLNSVKLLVSADVPKTTGEEVSPKAKKVTKTVTTPVFNKKDAPMTRDDWEAKDRRISRQGVIQAAVQAVGPVVSLENLYDEAEKLANKMLEFVNG